MEHSAKESFSEVLEKGNVTAAAWKGLSSACGINKRLRTGFQHSQQGKISRD